MAAEEFPELIPARMVNEFVYCPRLFWLEYVEREFASSYDTVDGERIHRRVDKPTGKLPDKVATMRAAATSVELTSERFGVVAKIDVVEADGERVVPVDFKRGKMPAIDGGVYYPERVQLGLAAILLREAGYSCDVGRIYYAASRTYVDVAIDDTLVAQTVLAVDGVRQMRLRGTIPEPLVDSPKCGRCSLHAICLPDETNALKLGGQHDPILPFAAPGDDEVPLYVLEPGARLGLSGEVLQVRTDSGVVADARLLEIASISLFGNVQISTQAMRAVLQRDVPVFFLSYGGWLTAASATETSRPH